jgi:hypothetical protein
LTQPAATDHGSKDSGSRRKERVDSNESQSRHELVQSSNKYFRFELPAARSKQVFKISFFFFRGALSLAIFKSHNQTIEQQKSQQKLARSIKAMANCD